MKLRQLLNEAMFWGGSHSKAFKTTESVDDECNCQNEDGSYLPVDVRTKHDVQTEAKMDTKAFVKAVQDEFDVETLQLMQGVIQKQITLVQKMQDTANPRKTVKGFRRENVKEDYAKDMQKEFEKKSKYDYSTVLNTVRRIKDKFGWSAISNSHRLMNEIEKILPGVNEYLWDIQIGPVRSSTSHGKFSELFVNEKSIGNVFVK